MTRWAGALIALILAATAAFAVGVAVERHQRTTESAPAPGAQTESPSAHAAENGGQGAVTEGPHAGESSTTAGTGRGHTESSSETLLGVNPESTGLVIVAVVVSLLLALAVWRAAGTWWVLGAVTLAMSVFCALDVREIIHQANESHSGLTLLAAGVAALHLTAALAAARATLALRRSGPRVAPPRHAT